MKEKPWYRQFWPWFLIAIPLAGVAMSTITATTAIVAADQVVERREAPLTKTSWLEKAEQPEEDPPQ